MINNLEGKTNQEWLFRERLVSFGETDAAGVIHFHHLLRWCHEAWEQSLDSYGISLSDIFPTSNKIEDDLEVALPIVDCNAHFMAPIKTGDILNIYILPKKIDAFSFQVEFKFKKDSEEVAIGYLRHFAIYSRTRKKCFLPEQIERWIESSSVNSGIRST